MKREEIVPRVLKHLLLPPPHLLGVGGAGSGNKSSIAAWV